MRYNIPTSHRMPRSPNPEKASEKRSKPESIGSMLPASQAVKLCRKAGIKQQQGLVTKHIRETMFPNLVETIIKDAINLMDYSENKTIQLRHIEKAVQLRYKRRVY